MQGIVGILKLTGAIDDIVTVSYVRNTSVTVVFPVLGDVTVIVFEIIYLPLGPRVGIHILMSEARWETRTCVRTCTAIDSDLQTEVVDLLSCPMNAIWEPVGVGNEAACLRVTTFPDHPTVVNIDVLIPRILGIYWYADVEMLGYWIEVLPSVRGQPVSQRQ